MFDKRWIFLVGLAIAAMLALTSLASRGLPVRADSPPPPGAADVCAIVTTIPWGEDTDTLLGLLDSSRAETLEQLRAMKANMEQYEAEGYGWQNVIDDPGALDPRPGSWLIGALRLACEPPADS